MLLLALKVLALIAAIIAFRAVRRTAISGATRRAAVPSRALAGRTPVSARNTQRAVLAARRAGTTDTASSSSSPSQSQEPIMDQTHALLDLVCTYLEADDFAHHFCHEPPAIKTGFHGNTSTYAVQVVAPSDPAALGVYVRIPTLVPESHRERMAEAVTRANCGLLLGAFEYDIGEGTLGFRSTMPVADSTVTHEQFQHLLFSSLATADRYHRAFCRLIFGDDMSPAEVIAEVEMA
ncbi:MAG: YbjN domain-containing protein [Phycisphaerae bacterium]|nr:YbjN domain-containing protein [Phycisphaerae bacterium]